jgi:hypothetical protein
MTPADVESGLENDSLQEVENGMRTVVVAQSSRTSPERIVEALLCEQTTHERRESRSRIPLTETDDTEPSS